VNVSTPVLLDPGFAASVSTHLQTAGLSGRALEVEITESTAMTDHAQARRTLTALGALGIRTSIDDFGTGYSSLAYLDELHVHVLKIDRSFIARLGIQGDSDAIVRTIIELAHNMGLETVAEGVEDLALCPRLERMGCDCVQGFALARPMPFDSLLAWMVARRALGHPS
jgi:EAL domain-containing protein (putative c-di-GMP-specific phosphodiesterase class I)